MADEEFRRDLSRSTTVNSNSSRPLIPGGARDLPGTSTGNQRPATHPQNTAEIPPARSAEAPAGQSAVFPRNKGYFRTAMQYLREIEMQSTAAAYHETSSSRFGKGQTKRLREHEQTGDESESVAKRNTSSEKQVGTIAASLAMNHSSTATPASQGAHRSVMELDNIEEAGESGTQSQHEIATQPVDTSAFGSSHEVIIPGEGQPEETFDSAPDWMVDSGDSLPSTEQGFSGPGLDDLDLLADSSSPLSTQVVPADIAATNLSIDAGSTSTESTQILADSDYFDDATEIGSETASGLIQEGSVRSLGSPEERFDAFPELTDEDLAQIDALFRAPSPSRRDVAHTIHAVSLDDAFSREDLAAGHDGWLTNPAVHQETSRQESSPLETKSDDFPELTEEDLARIDALFEARSTSARDVAPAVPAAPLGDVFSGKDFAAGLDGLPRDPAAHQRTSRLVTSPSESNSNDSEWTDEELARIDALVELHSKRRRFEQDVAGKSHRLSLNEAIEEVRSPTTVSGTSVARAAPITLESGVSGLPQATQAEPSGSDVAGPLKIGKAPRVDIRRDASDKEKQKISLDYQVQSESGASYVYQPRHPSIQTIFDAEHLGDHLLIGNEPIPPWPHPLNHVMRFETCKQLFERLRKWPTAEELENSVILVKADGAQRSYMPRNQLLLHLGPEKYLERMNALGLSGNAFSGLKSGSKYFYDTPAGPRISEHDYEFPRQAGVHNPEVMVQHPSGTFFSFWPKLLRLERLATVTDTYGAENVWLKSPGNAYMTPETYNSKVANGAENLFIEFIHPTRVHDHVGEPGTSNAKTVGDLTEDRAQHADRLADQSMGRSGHGRDAQRGTRAFEPRVRESYGL
ncbi:virA/G regulated protein [Rhizobium rhizogenes]|uniref:virA/G regulated protein n=1 Tax=Rhizobium rhizogenes TaxID=359 RepID=UPI0015726698|nr:virA/G regulated protein [Rhizobium rhizogenes]NTH68699.1 virA/G regulated protein [Rhizobium rhizogenes]NTI39676.1 virA/G regulated protein [Rhizobium rhizogenes]NTI72242.1 virA/G regulated protein [Rhizobium rhizogenes]WEO69897.1 virA/G regulated protein [Rhizobium rhizogenes]